MTSTTAIANPIEATETESDSARADAFYNEFFRNGGWKYSTWREFWWHRRHVVKRFGLHRGMKLLEVACGNGFHTNLFRQMGFDATGIDRSTAGIEWARTHFPKSRYHCCDMFDELPVAEASFDVVLARGCSHYHYDLMTDKAIGTTNHLLRYLKPNGVFVMVIVTDLTGRRGPGSVWQNKLIDYEQHFSSFGRPWSVDWHKGMAICGLWNSPESAECATA